MTDRVLLTREGAQKLRVDLEEMERERPKISEQIGAAREHGDLKENAEYHAAKEKQGLLEAKIQQLKSTLARAEIIDPEKLPKDGRIRFGTRVELLQIETSKEMAVRIVGEQEASSGEGDISFKSPLASALLGKAKEEVVEVQTPGGTVLYRVVEVLQ